MTYITTKDGVKLYVEQTGSGEPILFMHEFGGHYLSWEPQVRYFSRRYNCISYAARGRWNGLSEIRKLQSGSFQRPTHWPRLRRRHS